jgi:hypothetical protein
MDNSCWAAASWAQLTQQLERPGLLVNAAGMNQSVQFYELPRTRSRACNRSVLEADLQTHQRVQMLRIFDRLQRRCSN